MHTELLAMKSMQHVNAIAKNSSVLTSANGMTVIDGDIHASVIAVVSCHG